jgi:arylsulfatase A-like enzyme
VTTSLCSPSRASILTGLYAHRHRVIDNNNPLPPGLTFFPQYLQAAGYETAFFGKWHMGSDSRPGHGFGYTYTMTGGSRSYTDPVMYRNGERVEEKGYLTELMTRHATEFLDQQQSAKPWFLSIGYLNPHTPYSGHPQKYYDMYANTKFDTVGWEPPAPNALRERDMLKDIVGNLRRAAAATSALDDQIPILLRKLEERGMRDNTLVIFTGDNGYLLGRHGLWSKGLASDPINMYDEVVAVPMIWVWPGKLPAEATVPEMISFYDFVPSLCEITGTTAPARGLTGRSYVPLATRKPLPKKQPWRNRVFAHFRNTEMAREPRFKLVLRNEGQGPNEFYDLQVDPGEKKNEYDNPQYITVRDRLAQEIASWRQRTAS